MDSENERQLLQLHIAEYQMLTTRCTTWITLQYGLWSLLAIFLTIIATIWNSIDHIILIWLTVTTIQFITNVWAYTVTENFNAIIYVETNLRKMVEAVIHEKGFWKYEKYLLDLRKKKTVTKIGYKKL